MKALGWKDIVLYEDDRIVVVNKPPHISSLDERTAHKSSLLQMARSAHPGIILCHRLDKETSGVLVMARDEETYRHVSMQFEHRKVQKYYHAVVEGIHKTENMTVDLPIGMARNGLMRIDFSDGKEAVTHFNALEHFRHFTLMECQPVTGRTHQIRVHLNCRGMHIAHDLEYGGTIPFLSRIKRHYRISEHQEEPPMIRRMALHARRIVLTYGEGLHLDIEAPYPEDFRVMLKVLNKYDV
jgi:23S rRNA pseudouridine955/2504/2580 synthase